MIYYEFLKIQPDLNGKTEKEKANTFPSNPLNFSVNDEAQI
jgi:hypothetical protein